MKQLAYITQGHSEYDPALRELLDATGIDAEEFVGLDYFSLTPGGHALIAPTHFEDWLSRSLTQRRAS